MRDFERARGGAGTSAKPSGTITDKLDDGKTARATGAEASGLGLTLELMMRGDDLITGCMAETLRMADAKSMTPAALEAGVAMRNVTI